MARSPRLYRRARWRRQPIRNLLQLNETQILAHVIKGQGYVAKDRKEQLTQYIIPTCNHLSLIHLDRGGCPGSIRSDIAEQDCVPLVRVHAIAPSKIRMVAAVAAPVRPRAAIVPTENILVDSILVGTLKAGPQIVSASIGWHQRGDDQLAGQGSERGFSRYSISEEVPCCGLSAMTEFRGVKGIAIASSSND